MFKSINHWKVLLRSKGKDAFVLSLPRHAKLMDVGCGNNSPIRVKGLRPDIWYVGLDVEDYEQSGVSKSVADDYRIATPDQFLSYIRMESETMDAVLSAHNLEHCDFRYDVLMAMCNALKPGGRMYLAYPSEASVKMPSRAGTLCYYDDNTHVDEPPDWGAVIKTLRSSGMTIEFVRQRYRPLLPLLIGILLEPWSIWAGRVAPLGSTWALYGFETVIWARKAL